MSSTHVWAGSPPPPPLELDDEALELDDEALELDDEALELDELLVEEEREVEPQLAPQSVSASATHAVSHFFEQQCASVAQTVCTQAPHAGRSRGPTEQTMWQEPAFAALGSSLVC